MRRWPNAGVLMTRATRLPDVFSAGELARVTGLPVRQIRALIRAATIPTVDGALVARHDAFRACRALLDGRLTAPVSGSGSSLLSHDRTDSTRTGRSTGVSLLVSGSVHAAVLAAILLLATVAVPSAPHTGAASAETARPRAAADTRETVGLLVRVMTPPGPETASRGSGTGGGSGAGVGVGPGTGRDVGPGEGGGIGGGAYRPGSGIAPPGLLREVTPDYTEQARRAGLEGEVLLEIVVGPDGGVRDVKVLRRLGAGLDEQAVEAVRQWRFSPTPRDTGRRHRRGRRGVHAAVAADTSVENTGASIWTSPWPR